MQISDRGASPTNHCWCQKTRVIAFSCGIKISAVPYLILSQSTRVTNGQADGQTDRITTPKTALAYVRRVVNENILLCKIFCKLSDRSIEADSFDCDDLEVGVSGHKLLDKLREVVCNLVNVGRQQRRVVHVAVSATDRCVDKQNVRLFHLSIAQTHTHDFTGYTLMQPMCHLSVGRCERHPAAFALQSRNDHHLPPTL